MAIPVYLTLTASENNKIRGSSDVVGRQGTIEVIAYNHNLSISTDNNTGKLTALRVHAPFIFSKEIDRSSTELHKALTNPATLDSAEFKWYRINDGGDEIEYYSVTLKKVKVVKITSFMYDVKDPTKEMHNHLEEVELRYEEIIWNYMDGNLIHSDSWNARPSA